MTFANKTFNGTVYTFAHLSPMQLQVALSGPPAVNVAVNVTFGCHCFTESFDTALHEDHHRYTHRSELRAFDVLRFQSSLQLPVSLNSLLTGMVHRADRSYTFVTQIALPPAAGQQSYSVFFSLEKSRRSTSPAVEMYVKSAYLRRPAATSHSQSWRFKALVGQISGAFGA